jgi:hypothetical protein
MMSDILGSWIILNVIALFVLFVTSLEGANCSFVNPRVIYDNIKVNWFGAWLLAVVFNILFPTMAIPYWIYKICTVGRALKSLFYER